MRWASSSRVNKAGQRQSSSQCVVMAVSCRWVEVCVGVCAGGGVLRSATQASVEMEVGMGRSCIQITPSKPGKVWCLGWGDWCESSSSHQRWMDDALLAASVLNVSLIVIRLQAVGGVDGNGSWSDKSPRTTYMPVWYFGFPMSSQAQYKTSYSVQCTWGWASSAGYPAVFWRSDLQPSRTRAGN